MTALLENRIQASPCCCQPSQWGPPQPLSPTEEVSRSAPGRGRVPAKHKRCQTKADVKMSLNKDDLVLTLWQGRSGYLLPEGRGERAQGPCKPRGRRNRRRRQIPARHQGLRDWPSICFLKH